MNRIRRRRSLGSLATIWKDICRYDRQIKTRVFKKNLRLRSSAAIDRGWKVGFGEMLYASIRRIAARNLVAILIAIAILIGIPSSGYAQDSAAMAAHQDVARPGHGAETSTSSDRLRALIDEALSRSPIVLAARSHWQA